MEELLRATVLSGVERSDTNAVGGGRREILPPRTSAAQSRSSAGQRRSFRGGGVAPKQKAAKESTTRCTLLSIVPRLISPVVKARVFAESKRLGEATRTGLVPRHREKEFRQRAVPGFVATSGALTAVDVGNRFHRWCRSKFFTLSVDAGRSRRHLECRSCN